MIVRKSSYPEGLNEQHVIDEQPEIICRGGSCIIDPY
jgi:nitrilase